MTCWKEGPLTVTVAPPTAEPSARTTRPVSCAAEATDASEARGVVDRLAGELFANPLIESWTVEPTGGAA